MRAVAFNERKTSWQASHGNQVFVSWVIFFFPKEEMEEQELLSVVAVRVGSQAAGHFKLRRKSDREQTVIPGGAFVGA